MAKKQLPQYQCKACGDTFSRWAGKCPSCGEWNQIEEMANTSQGRFDTPISLKPRDRRYTEPKSIGSVVSDSHTRTQTGFSELDLVLGGGIVPGSLVLVGGEPGVGKSTLVLEIAKNIANQGTVLYISGEESASQIGLRAKRMGVTSENILLSSEVYAENIAQMISDIKPKVVFIDSIQTIIKESLVNQAGTITQLRESSQVFLETAKRTSVPIFLIGHITKDGQIAGPKVLEHLVDTVLYFEGDRFNYYRILRAVKNRFGAVGDTAIFEMVLGGLSQVLDRHRLFISPETEERSGSVLSSVMEGSRAISVEVQALVTKSSYGQARRMAEGLDNRRVILLSAVIEKYLGLPLSESDIFSNLAGGLSVDEPSLDLAIVASIVSSFRDKPVSRETGYLGEVGLSGEVRSVGQMSLRIKELVGIGISQIYIPHGNWKEVEGMFPSIELVPIKHLQALGL
ncbi:ATP-dependent serine protease [Leptospira biflexa serovar Patoc strain 'Patoc 1 (Ames)']|uniref:DNA repair protein RadA n=1 Tax=Leptospira biflexa serovar Patoc (strain Patoc 1 / ATCC 23582 / Paris) TaxID=456481 RepID=B0SL97_LEPBP|nr:DNA repair protein RadA [Leptospira biflexa]ABZ93281.1 ATP-dependent serine protease [Leptospira biflexa serovar Patoc strain 'Patoc 1 (Ames)']ABZ96904.1 DNA repair protein [Leptospira biflexa serovar Patoc strain 'Patoc 1 (Paris)']